MRAEQLLLINSFYSPTYLESDYIISKSNYNAYSALMGADLNFCNLIYGNCGSGKTHLAHIWKEKFKAKFITDLNPEALICGSCVIENIESIANETALFHCYNTAIENKNFLLLTSKVNAYELPFILPDLCSRMRGMSAFKLEDPDDELLKVIIIKEFHMRNLKLDLKLVNHLLITLPRSVGYITRFIDFIDKHSLQYKKTISMQYINSMIAMFVDPM